MEVTAETNADAKANEKNNLMMRKQNFSNITVVD